MNTNVYSASVSISFQSHMYVTASAFFSVVFSKPCVVQYDTNTTWSCPAGMEWLMPFSSFGPLKKHLRKKHQITVLEILRATPKSNQMSSSNLLSTRIKHRKNVFYLKRGSMTQVFNLDIVFYIYLAYILHCLNKFIPPNTSQYKCLTCSNTAIFPGAREKIPPRAGLCWFLSQP